MKLGSHDLQENFQSIVKKFAITLRSVVLKMNVESYYIFKQSCEIYIVIHLADFQTKLNNILVYMRNSIKVRISRKVS